MARKRRPPPRFSPPSRTPSKRELKRRVRAVREAREAERKARAARLREASAFKVCWALLEEATFAEWSGEQARPVAFWTERWRYTLASGEPSWDEILDWRFAMADNATIERYLSRRAVSVMVLVFDPAEGRELWLTVAAAGDWFNALACIAKKVGEWSQSYGKRGDKRSEEEEDFARILEVVVLLREGGVHKQWRSHVRGVIEEREELGRAAQEKARKAARRKAKRKRARR